jgi:hypothetical protein
MIKSAFQIKYEDISDFPPDLMLSFHDDAINNLYEEGLIGHHVYGSKKYLEGISDFKFSEGFTGGLLVSPSTRGAELFS